MKTIKSSELYNRSVQLIPGGVNSPVRSFKSVGTEPVFFRRGTGSKIYDADGNEYLDYVCSWGPLILGHAHERITEAVIKACEQGLTFGMPTEGECELAELICGSVPSVEKVRLVSSGTEAVMSAVRLARAYTGRDMILKFQGCYHGHSDGMLVKAGSGALTHGVPDCAGVPYDYSKNTLIAKYNHTENVKALFEKYGNEIAAVIVEPVAANMGVVPPKDGFLAALRDITVKYGALLIFDEVITGFRLGLGGAQEYYGVLPDLTTMGKIIGGGMPLAAYGGRSEIMDLVSPAGPVYQAGTLSGNPVAVAAGIETIKILNEKKEIYTEISEKTEKLEQAFIESFKGNITVNRVGSLMSVFFGIESVTDYGAVIMSDVEEYKRLFKYMLKNGILIAPSPYEAMFISFAHSEDDIENSCRIIRNYRRQNNIYTR